MESTYVLLLSFIVFLPAIGALVMLALPFLFPKDRPDAARFFTLAITIFTFLPVLWIAAGGGEAGQFDTAVAQMQNVFVLPWIPTFNIQYFMGMDGISFPLVLLTALISLLAMGASWSIKKHVKAYCVLFLLLETGMLGVFLALDFFLFYVFWEVMLLPMYFLIGVWGGPRKEYAAIKFFLYTLLGSVLMLIAVLLLYFNSDLQKLTPQQLAGARVLDPILDSRDLTFAEATDAQLDAAAAELNAQIDAGEHSRHTFNLLALAAMGQHTDLFDNFGYTETKSGEREPIYFLGRGIQFWAFILLFIGFVIKVPSVPVHTWLPDAHVEAPTPISMILAGVLLKMGGYGIIRICYPICPQAGYELMWVVCIIGVVSMVYGAFAALAQKDFKRMVAYSSVSHMGYVVLGLGVWSATPELMYNAEYWIMGVKGAMFQMIGHGISSAGMFFMVGVVYDRVHHRNLNEYGGLFGKMPVYTALAIGLFFAGLGLPGLCGFIGEVFVVLSVYSFSITLAVISAFVVIITAAYILWAIQRVYLGAEYKGPHEEELRPMTAREVAVAVPLFVLAIWLGVFPQTMFQYMDATIDQQVTELADWTRREVPVETADSEPDQQQQTEPAKQAAKADEGGRRLTAKPGGWRFAQQNPVQLEIAKSQLRGVDQRLSRVFASENTSHPPSGNTSRRLPMRNVSAKTPTK